jgi:hypothetical protein
MTLKGARRGGLILALCLTSGLVCAFVFVIIEQLTLPPTDLAYGMELSSTFTSPFLLGATVFWGIQAGLFAFPFALSCLRDRNLFACYLFVTATVLAEICIVTPVLGPLGFLGAFPTVVWALFYCKSSNSKRFRLKSGTHRPMNTGETENPKD